MRKIATCCYCGTRAALVLRGDSRHELSCAACGAPLHEMKAVPCDRQERGTAQRGAARRRPAPHPFDLRREDEEERRRAEYEAARQPKRRRKRRKPLFRRALEEIWDVVEDIID